MDYKQVGIPTIHIAVLEFHPQNFLPLLLLRVASVCLEHTQLFENDNHLSVCMRHFYSTRPILYISHHVVMLTVTLTVIIIPIIINNTVDLCKVSQLTMVRTPCFTF